MNPLPYLPVKDEVCPICGKADGAGLPAFNIVMHASDPVKKVQVHAVCLFTQLRFFNDINIIGCRAPYAPKKKLKDL